MSREELGIPRWMIILALVFGGSLLFAMLLPFGWINVRPTEAAVEVDKFAHKVNPLPLGVGYHFFNRWSTDMVIYEVQSRAFPSQSMASEGQKEYNMELKTNDGQNVNIDITILYALRSNEVPALHQTIGPNYADQILLTQMRSEARLAIGQYTAEELYQGKVREEIQNHVRQKLSENLEKYPAIQIQDALIRHFSFSPAFEQAIEQKKLAEQQVEVNKKRALAQEEESKRQEAQARGAKLQVIQEAQAQSESISTMAEGKAKAMRIEADAKRYQLEQEAAGDLARYKAEAEGKRLSADALGGGQNVVALEFAKNIPDKLQIWGIPTGSNNTTLMDLNGVFKGMLDRKDK